MTADELAFLAAICADSTDDTVRLAYADWLDEQDQPDRAEFIRVQCELARPKWTCPGCCPRDPKYNTGGSLYPYCHEGCEQCDEHSALRRRERELWESGLGVCLQNDVDFLSLNKPLLIDRSGQWARGFLSAITCTAEDWERYGSEITKTQPIEHVALTTRPQNVILEGVPPHNVVMEIYRDWFAKRWPGIKFTLPGT